ncbi:MAG: signal peptide peptidase SppA [Haliea sp.]|uniref:signal peptide peptidase SppA n=1 Tax=Haliea sp. TaxID=1932666 RepID=UPI000C52DC80|nr:signal peptide peptidase SppA [Haliea sp.]MBM70274.1 signal peptide peptidase SppA [Haliea sp.]|tara:strand:- start:14821 stop:16665 length:1845 start_codon:yes stop_codon:yes gene_type:complete
MSRPSPIRRLFSALWRGLTWFRLALSNLLFLAFLVFIYVLYFSGGPPPQPEKAALLLNLGGTLVDEKSEVSPLQALAGEPSPAEREIVLRDVLDAIQEAARDPAITALVMELDFLVSAGISKSLEIAAAIDTFKATGKPVIAVGDYFTQDQYLLASQADEVILHPMGAVPLEGFASYRNHFRQALDKALVTMHVFYAGEHKSMAEPFLRDDMSEGEKAITLAWLEDLWREYVTVVESRRNLPPGSLDSYINRYAEHLTAAGGNSARVAQEQGLVDTLLSRADANDYLIERVGAEDDEGFYEAVFFESYINSKRPVAFTQRTEDRVAVVTAEGNMMSGEQPPGTIGGDSLSRLLRQAAEQPGVKALVLRVNTGGGSVLAAERIRQTIARIREAGTPVVISMGAIAASGGYYIAAEADEIWATPTTITGSIGVFAAFPTFERLLERIGVTTDGVGTTELAGSLRLDRPLNPQVAETLASGVDFTYREFLQLVASGRGLSEEAVQAAAGGRVWSAADAQVLGLIDELGSLREAIAAAAELGGLDPQRHPVEYVQQPLSPRDMLLRQLASRVGVSGLLPGLDAGMQQLLQPVATAARTLTELNDPAHLYMRCVGCAAP